MVTAGIGMAREECRGIMTLFGVLDRVLTRQLPLEPPDDPHAAILPTPIDNDAFFLTPPGIEDLASIFLHGDVPA